jgi:hypothetical protein
MHVILGVGSAQFVLTFIIRVQNNGVCPKCRRERERRPEEPHDETVASKSVGEGAQKLMTAATQKTSEDVRDAPCRYAGMRHSLVAAVNEAW